MILLTIDEIIELHSRLIKRTGGLDGIRDLGLLESAVYSAENSFGGLEIYPSIEEKAARVAFAIVNNHAFLDGNKRIGMLVMLMILNINDISIVFTQEELIDLGLYVADGSYEYEQILEWIQMHEV